MPVAYPRRMAALFLRFAIWIAPHDTLDWGRGMLSELNHVQGNWAALVWAVGSAGVLAKHAVLSVILTGSHRRTISSASELFAKEGPMRKTNLTAIGACTVASLLFFFAPIFRQAFHVSLAQWHDVIHIQSEFDKQGPDSDLELETLARKAEKNHDADGLAFVATRTTNQSESARLADKAVHLDAKLTWIYAVVAVKYPSLPDINQWVPLLQQSDPQNALSNFIVAEEIDIEEIDRKQIAGRVEEKPTPWQNAMAEAFQSRKLDDYLARLTELNRRVLLRYRVDDPFQTLGDERWYGLPSYAAQDSSFYANSLLESGRTLKARGDRKGAFDRYLIVARFGQMLGSADWKFLLRGELQEAYKRLATISEEEGNKVEAAFYTSLADQTDRAQQEELIWLRKRVKGSDVSHWNGFLVKASGLEMLFSGGLLLACALAVMVRSKSLRLGALRPSRLTLAVGLCGAIGALLSSAVLYLSYRPYAEILQRFVRNGDETSLAELSSFLSTTQLPLGAQGFLDVSEFVFYFWFGVILLCIFALLVAVLCRFQHRARANVAT
jgi:hypothetical protein